MLEHGTSAHRVEVQTYRMALKRLGAGMESLEGTVEAPARDGHMNDGYGRGLLPPAKGTGIGHRQLWLK